MEVKKVELVPSSASGSKPQDSSFVQLDDQLAKQNPKAQNSTQVTQKQESAGN